jgi:hypothetical protein
MPRKQRVIYDKTRNLFWKATHDPHRIKEGYSGWEKGPKKASKYSMSESDTIAIEGILGYLAIGFPNSEFEVHTYEVIPAQFKKVD